MKRTPFNEIIWLALDWQRPFEFQAVIDMLTHLASHSPQVPLIFEVRGCRKRISYYLGVDRRFVRIITDVMKAHGDVRFTQAQPSVRVPVNEARQLKIGKPLLSLNTNIAEAVTRAALAALLQPNGFEQSVLQIVLSRSYNPTPMPHTLSDPHASWAQAVFSTVEQATPEARRAVSEKIGTHGFCAVIRLGATGTRATAQGHILSLLSALRTLSSAGVVIQAAAENPDKLNLANIPWQIPLRLSVKELANFLLLPAGDTELPGVTGLHPKQIMPPTWYRNPLPAQSRTFAVSLDKKHKLSISPKDSREHAVILGSTGSGKSTLIQHLILSDIYAGRGILVIDPKADLVNGILARIPKHREDDVIILDPSSPCSIGFNPLSLGGHNPNLTADAILNVFQSLFSDNWGIRSQDVISASLLTLTKIKGATLLWLPTLLTDSAFRQRVTAGIKDKIGLEPFWTAFESMKDSERRQEIAPTLNKIRQFLLRPGLRNILGQSEPKFNLSELFTKQKIILAPLNKGQIGGESAKLLGSLLIGQVWNLALARAGIPEEHRKLASIYIDELQDYISAISSDISDVLSQARGLGIGITMAHQYRSQVKEPEVLAGIDANARNKIVFGLSASDAKAMAAMAPELIPEDFMALPRYHVYTSFNDNGKNTGWVSGQTLPMTRAICDPAQLREKVAARYGKPGDEVEREYLELLASCSVSEESEIEPCPVGRREKE